MGGEGHMLDMIRRLKDGKEASRLRRERRNDKLGRLRRNNDPYLHTAVPCSSRRT